jgi:hypothetical protein
VREQLRHVEGQHHRVGRRDRAEIGLSPWHSTRSQAIVPRTSSGTVTEPAACRASRAATAARQVRSCRSLSVAPKWSIASYQAMTGSVCCTPESGYMGGSCARDWWQKVT